MKGRTCRQCIFSLLNNLVIHKQCLNLHIIKLKTIVNRKTYTFDEAFKASLDYFTGDELAAKVWVNKYALKDAFGNIYEESPVDMHHRLASEIAV